MPFELKLLVPNEALPALMESIIPLGVKPIGWGLVINMPFDKNVPRTLKAAAKVAKKAEGYKKKANGHKKPRRLVSTRPTGVKKLAISLLPDGIFKRKDLLDQIAAKLGGVQPNSSVITNMLVTGDIEKVGPGQYRKVNK